MKTKYVAMSKKEARAARERQKREALELRKAKRRKVEAKRQLLKSQGKLVVPKGKGTGPKTSEKRKQRKLSSTNKLMSERIVSYARENVPIKHAKLEEPSPNIHSVDPITVNEWVENKPRRRERDYPAKNMAVVPTNKPKKPCGVIGQTDFKVKRKASNQRTLPKKHTPCETAVKLHFHDPRGKHHVRNQKDLLRALHGGGSFRKPGSVAISRSGPDHSFEPRVIFLKNKRYPYGKWVTAFSDTNTERAEKLETYLNNQALRKEATEARKKGKPVMKVPGQPSEKKEVNMEPKAVEARNQARAIANRRKLFRETRDQRVAAAIALRDAA